MVFENTLAHEGVQVFGIQIPITGSNVQRTIAALLAEPDLAARETDWHLSESVPPLGEAALSAVHDPAYVARLLDNSADGPLVDREPSPAEQEVIRTFELFNPDGSYHRFDPLKAEKPLSQLRDQGLRMAAGTVRAAELAMDDPDGFVFYLGGGMHHGHYDFGEGFCLVNDLVLAVRALQASGRIRTAWILDVDAHKGDGTAALCVNDDTIRTMSVHMAAGWPLDQPELLADGKANPCFLPSDHDVPIAEGEEEHYNSRLRSTLETMEEQYPLPDFVLVVDGADPYERDQLPSAELLKMDRAAMMERDAFLYRWVRQRSLPSLFVMAGNYGYHSWEVYAQFLAAQIRGELD